MKYRQIIWDWNGTLLDDAGLCMAVMNGLLEIRGLPRLTAPRYAEVFGFPVVDYYRKLGFDFDREPFETVSTAFIVGYEAGRQHCQLRTGARACLDQWARLGVTQTLLSASKQAYLEDAVAGLGLTDRFDGLYGVDDHHAHGKTAVGHRLMAETGANPSATLMVGDTLHDAEVAASLGVNCVLIPSGHQSLDRLKGVGVPVLKSLAELPSVF